jgi:hypothetical protein
VGQNQARDVRAVLPQFGGTVLKFYAKSSEYFSVVKFPPDWDYQRATEAASAVLDFFQATGKGYHAIFFKGNFRAWEVHRS